MDRSQLARLFQGVAPTVLFAEPLAKHTTWRIGGPADVLIAPETPEQVADAMARAVEYEVPVFVLGRGSNLLIQDGGVRGLVIKLGDDFAAVSVEGNELSAQAGRTLVSAAHIAIRHGLSGLEFATGIPGSVGGAVAMNAGAHGGEIQHLIQSVEVLHPDGRVLTLQRDELEFRYRHSIIRERQYVVLSATFALQPGDSEEMLARVRAWSKKRQATQPLAFPSCGSVFRNPDGDFAARLIEAAGLKGARVGNAMISDLHANFIVNLGEAKATDVLALMRLAQAAVLAQFGVELAPEVRVVGEEETRG